MRTLLLSCGLLSVIPLALSTGCGGGGAGGSGGGAGSSSNSVSSSSSNSSSSSGGNPSDITGTAKSTWLTDTGETADIPEPSLTVSAVYQKPDKTFDEIQGTYDAATGAFVIKAVPMGPYYLRTGPTTYYAMTERTGLDLGFVRGGRPDAVKVMQIPTSLTLNLTSLTAWQGNDTMELFSLGANSFSDIVLISSMPPMAGATSLPAFDADLSQFIYPGLIDGSKGDKAMVTHLTTRMAGAVAYQALGQALALPSITMTDGQASMSGGAFKDVPQTNIAMNWKRSAFAALIASAVPGGVVGGYDTYVFIEPGGKTRGSTAPPVSLINLFDNDGTDAMFSLDYGNPFPATWGVLATVDVQYSMHENTPGVIKHIDGGISVTAPIDMLFQGPVVPQVSPPTGITIAGQPATNDLMGVGFTPVIAWKAPTMGTPTHYTVRIKSFGPMNATVAVLSTTDTSVIVPSGVLDPSVSYGAIIRADAAVYDPKAPYRYATTGAYADALTPLFSP